MAKHRKPNSDRAWRGRSFRTWAPMKGTTQVEDSQIVKYRRIRSEKKAERRDYACAE